MKRKLLFIAVPRTGSMSMIEALKPHGLHAVKYDVGKVDTVFDPERPLTTFYHASIPSLIDANIITREWLSERFVVSFLRNPWDRMVSLYSYLFGTLERHRYRLGDMSIDRFIETVTASSHPIGPYNWLGLSQAAPQTTWTRRCGHEFVGRFERLEADWAILCDMIGASAPLPHLGKSSRDDGYRWAYTKSTQYLVSRYYAADIQRGGYTF